MFGEKYPGTSGEKVEMLAEKLSSKIGIFLPVNLGKLPEERKYSIFS
jgi:hypothetical protein